MAGQAGPLGAGLYPTVLADAGGGGGAGELSPIPGVTNWTRANNARIIPALTALKAGTADARVAILGDSTTVGFGATPTDGWNGARVLAAPAKTATYLAGVSVPAAWDDIVGRAAAATNFANYILPEVVTLGTGWSTGLSSMGGNDLGLSGVATGDLVYQAAVAMTACRVMVYQYTAAGAISLKASFDGGSTYTAPQGAGGNNGMQWVTFVNPGAPSTTVQFQRVGGTCNIQGVEALVTSSKKLRIMNCGRGSSTTAGWTTTTNVYDDGSVYMKAGQQLSIINLTINDRSAAADPTVSMANLHTMIGQCQANGSDVWLVVPNPGNNCTGAVLNAYRDAIIAQAAADSVPCMNLMGPVSDWVGAGYMYDGIHPNAAGYAYIGTQYGAMLAALYAAA